MPMGNWAFPYIMRVRTPSVFSYAYALMHFSTKIYVYRCVCRDTHTEK